MLTSSPNPPCAPVLGPLFPWDWLMASLAQLSTSWCRSSVKVPLPFWVLEPAGGAPVAWDRVEHSACKCPEPFVELIPLDPKYIDKRHQMCTRKFSLHHKIQMKQLTVKSWSCTYLWSNCWGLAWMERMWAVTVLQTLLQFLRSLLLRLNFALEGTLNLGSELKITIQITINI